MRIFTGCYRNELETILIKFELLQSQIISQYLHHYKNHGEDKFKSSNAPAKNTSLKS